MWIAAVVLAAGKSERMGKNKLKQKLNGKALIDHVLDALEETKIDQIIVVLGNKPDELGGILESRSARVEIVLNENYERGMTSSFKKGLERAKEADASFLILGDELILEPTFLDDAIDQMRTGKPLIVCPIHNGRKGHPLLFSKELFQEILDLKETEVVRDIVHRHLSRLLTIESADWTVMDIDTPEDFMKAEKRLLNRKMDH
jgi:molybdenum cofactor cytidylyltransferase